MSASESAGAPAISTDTAAAGPYITITAGVEEAPTAEAAAPAAADEGAEEHEGSPVMTVRLPSPVETLKSSDALFDASEPTPFGEEDASSLSQEGLEAMRTLN